MSTLEGIRVLDLCHRYPGAYTAMFLGDFGAEVIKVDPPLNVLGYPPGWDHGEKFAAYYAPDRNKKSLILDLKTERGQEVFHRLVKTSDVLLEGFRPGVTKQLKCDYETLSQINPRLVYCSLTGYGGDGPYVGIPGHDMNFCAIGGALDQVGPRDGPPYFPSNYIADMAGGGLHGVIGILLALMARNRTGRGQHVDISLLDGVISLKAQEASHYFRTGVVPRRGETATTGSQPWAQNFKCKDGEYLTTGCSEVHIWRNFCRVLGREDLVPYQRETGPKREWVIASLATIFLTRTRDEWFEFLKDKYVCVAPVYHLNETFSDPQVLHRKMVMEFEHPALGKIKQIGIPIKLSDTPGEVRSLGVPTGTDTDRILKELGYSARQIADFHADAVVWQS